MDFRGDRRDALRQAFGQWVERLVDATEERMSPQRYLRPPGALPELGFLAACTRCGDCIPACPVQAIVRAPTESGPGGGHPVPEHPGAGVHRLPRHALCPCLSRPRH